MKKLLIFVIFFILFNGCTGSTYNHDYKQLLNEDYYLGLPGSKIFYKTTTKETQEKYHLHQFYLSYAQ